MRSTFSVVLFPLDEKRAVWLRPVSKRLSHKGRHEAANTFDWRRLLLFTSSVWFGFWKFCIEIAERQQTVFCLEHFFAFTFFHLSFFMHILRVYHTAFIMSAKQQIWHHIFLFKRSPLTLKSIKYFVFFFISGLQVKGERIYNGALQNGSGRRKPRGGGVNRNDMSKPKVNIVNS